MRLRLLKRLALPAFLFLLPVDELQQGRAGGIPIGLPSQEITQLLVHAQLIAQYARMADQIYNQVRMIRMMTQEGLSWGQIPGISGMVLNDVGQIRGLIQQTQGLSYGFAATDSAFRNVYQPYAMSTTPYYASYQNWAGTTLNTVLGALHTAGIQQDQVWSEPQMMGTFQQMMQTTVGRNQAIELTNTISSEMVSQMEKLRLLVASDMQSKAAYTGYQIVQD